MYVIGSDFHPSWQQISWLDLATGEAGGWRIESQGHHKTNRRAQNERLGRFWVAYLCGFQRWAALPSLALLHA